MKFAFLPIAAFAAIVAGTAAPAATFVFNTKSASDGTASSKTFSATTGGYTINMRATGWQAVATNISGRYDIDSAKLGTYTAGLGVLAAGEGSGDAEHQLDNVKGVDFILLQFSELVNLTQIGRTPFTISGYSPSGTTDSDAGYKAITSVGSAATWNQAIDLSNSSIDSSTVTSIDGLSRTSGSNYMTSLSSTAFSSTWLVSAAFASGANDGFKLSSISVSAVPESSTWAMMIVGFGVTGTAMRRRRLGAPNGAKLA